MSKEDKYPSRVADQFVVRLPPGMRDRIAVEAKKNNRSMNAEIVSILQSHYDEIERIETISAHPIAPGRDLSSFSEELQIAMDKVARELIKKYGFQGPSFTARGKNNLADPDRTNDDDHPTDQAKEGDQK